MRRFAFVIIILNFSFYNSNELQKTCYHQLFYDVIRNILFDKLLLSPK